MAAQNKSVLVHAVRTGGRCTWLVSPWLQSTFAELCRDFVGYMKRNLFEFECFVSLGGLRAAALSLFARRRLCLLKRWVESWPEWLYPSTVSECTELQYQTRLTIKEYYSVYSQS